MLRRHITLALVLLMALPAGLTAASVLSSSPTIEYVQEGGAQATIIRDQWGVPHVWADDLHSLFYANGYAQAQDRLAQMDILRHVGKGELAKLLGPAGLEMDLVTRRELYTDAERQQAFEELEPLWREAFTSFAGGVNQWIDEIMRDPSKMPVEYPALVAVPEPWDPKDTLAIAQYLLDVFGRGSGGAEARNAQILNQLKDYLGEAAGASAFGDLVWSYREDTYTTVKPGDLGATASSSSVWTALSQEMPHDLSDLDTLEPGQREAYQAGVAALDVADSTAPLHETLAALGWPLKFGSNAQTISADFAVNGKPLLYGGPQMAYYAPMIPYEIGLHGGGFEAVGMGVAGAPGVIIGRGPSHSWTVTSGSVDQVDLVVEKLVDHDTYLIDGQEVDMDCRTETHLVRPGPADFAPAQDPNWRPPMFDVVTQEVCRTVHGPVLARTGDGAYAFSSHRSYRGDEARSGVLWLQIGQTRSIEDIQDLLETFRFTFNFNIVEETGDIAYLHVGAQPIRDDRLDQRLPRPGWDSSYEWKGFLTGRDLPHVINPASGYTVNWNNNPAVGFPTGDIFEKWGGMQRAQLMDELLTSKIAQMGLLTMDDLRQVHFDASTRDPYADEFYALMKAGIYGADGVLSDQEAVALDALAQWKDTGFFYGGYGEYAGQSLFGGRYANTMPDGMALYELWRSELQTLVFEDELGPYMRELGWNPPETSDPHAADHGREDNKHSILFDAMRGISSHNWCDNIVTDYDESCEDMAAEAMQRVLASDDEWQDQPNRISKFSALGAGPSFEIPMTNRPSHQAFYDWGLPEGAERSRNALPPGASGHITSAEYLEVQGWLNGVPGANPPPHLADQLDMYVDFQDKPLLFTREAVEAFEESRTTVG